MSDEPPETATRFTGLAELYDRYRPSYPAAAIAAILDGLPISPTVIDVGAGTGISTRLLAAAGAHAIAIEPNDEMRGAALARGVDARPGSASATALADRCADAVTCFQAFHWFAHAEALAEFMRLLRGNGRVALVWNERDTHGDAFTRALRELERRFGDATLLAGIDFHDDSLEPLLRAAGLDRVRSLQFENEQRLDMDALVGRIRSTSYAPRSGSQLEDLTRALRGLHQRFADNSGHATLRYRTDVIIGEIVSH